MKSFITEIWKDVRGIKRWQMSVIVTLVFVVYGMLLFNPVTTYDFNSAKGDFLNVFLTYFFMHRAVQGLIAGAFHDFSPYWTVSVGLVFIVIAALFLVVLFKRLNACDFNTLIGTALWFSAPFFFNLSIYQHAFPSASIGFCCDILAALAFLELRRLQYSCCGLKFLAILLIATSTSIYQAHVGLVLTTFSGILVLDQDKGFRILLKDWRLIVEILCGSMVLWFILNHMPMILTTTVGVSIPKSGGAHDTIFWLDSTKTVWMNLKSLFVGFVLNWVYNAFFIIGLRWVLLSFVFCSVVGIMCAFHKQWVRFMTLFGFMFSVFALPIIQCSFANLRIYFGMIALVSFTGMLALQLFAKRRNLVVAILLIVILSMAHETSTLYYYNWKVKEHDKLHMSIVAHDLWAKYGLRIEKPVAIIGGWQHYPTCWEDLRPFGQLPLINHPFTTYSNVTCVNVPREFYMVAREKVGLLMPMPDLQTYTTLRSNMELLSHPPYPRPGYIFEHNDLIVVNLGKYNSQWGTFRYEDYSSPNEKLLRRTLGVDKIDCFLIRITKYFRDLAERYPWTVTVDI